MTVLFETNTLREDGVMAGLLEAVRVRHIIMALAILCALPIAIVFFGIIGGAFMAATDGEVNLRPNFFRREKRGKDNKDRHSGER